jgi:hypothetical protein
MISLQLLRKNFNLIDKGLYYSRITQCMLDMSSPKTTSFFPLVYSSAVLVHIVTLCSLYQMSLYEKNN